MLEGLFYNLYKLTVTTSLIIVLLLLLLPYVDRKFGVKWRKVIWLFLAIRLLIPFNLSVTNSLFKLPVIPESFLKNDWTMSVTIALTIIWLTGAFVYIRMQQLNFRHFKDEIMESAELAENSIIKDIFGRLREECRIKKAIRLYYSEKVKTPMVMGIVHPVMLLPMQEYSEEDISNIFHHEFAHIKSRDGWYKVFMTVIIGLHWFNPLIHLMVKFSYNDVELVCDKNVTKHMDQAQRAKYSKTILDTVALEKKRDMAAATCFYGNKKMLKKRIENVFDDSPKRSGYAILFLLTVVFIGMDLLISVKYISADSSSQNIVREYIEKPTGATAEKPTKSNMEYYVDWKAHPWNSPISVDLELCGEARIKLLEGLTDEESEFVSEQIRDAHHWIEYRLVYTDVWRPNAPIWNDIDCQTQIDPRLDYSGIIAIERLREIKELIDNEYLSIDINKAIACMSDAIDTRDFRKLYEFHQIVHDLDYWLFNYPLKTFKWAPPDWHGIYVAFGGIEAYKCVE